jgi:GNAT superfamily N-acetyltransferase
MTDIKPVTAADEADWMQLWNAYLRFYKTHLADGVTRATWRRILDEGHGFRCFIARDGAGQALGFALHWTHASSWCAVGDMYLEDLFVTADARGQGVGSALIQAVLDSAKAEKWDRLHWMASEDNANARALYDKLTGGFDGHLRYRIKL